MSQDKLRGRFVWYELMTTDMKAAATFYPKVTGWSVEDWEDSPMPYQIWKAGDTGIGGSMALPDEAKAMGAPPQWMSYVTVADVDASSRQADGLGGQVLKAPDDIPKVGRFSVISDPQGAMLILFRPTGDGPGPQGPPSPGRFSWHELMTSDPDRAWEFYRELFGWTKHDAVDMGEAGSYQMFGYPDMPVGGIFKQPAKGTGKPAWLYYVMVPDLDGALDQVRAGGGQVLNGPMEVPGGDRVAQCMDPQGAAFALHAKK